MVFVLKREKHERRKILIEIANATPLCVGGSLLQQLFHDYTGSGAIDCFSLMKINAAKQLILHGQLNLTQIADYLGYSSIHYFSRQFKKLTGMPPSKYAASAAQHESP